jgi:hypothetical protein
MLIWLLLKNLFNYFTIPFIQYFYRIYPIRVTVPYRSLLYVTVFLKILSLHSPFTVTFYRYRSHIPFHLPLPLLSLLHAKKYSATGIITFLVTRYRDRYFYHYIFVCNGKCDGKSNGRRIDPNLFAKFKITCK